jgi:hypothetical protein
VANRTPRSAAEKTHAAFAIGLKGITLTVHLIYTGGSTLRH